jgi:hypothetical protein
MTPTEYLLTLDVEALTEERNELEAKIERLKHLWYADADPQETEYAEDYAMFKEDKG